MGEIIPQSGTNYPPIWDKLSPNLGQIIPQQHRTLLFFVLIMFKRKKQPEGAASNALSGLTTTATVGEVTVWLKVKSWNLAK